MRSQFAAIACGVAALSLADAATAAPYVGLEAGWNHSRDETFIDNGKTIGTVEYNDGWIGGLAFGYAFPMGLRPEIEFARRRNGIADYEPSNKPASGTHPADSALIGLWYDLPFARAIHPSVGIGVGQAEVRYVHFNNAHNVDRTDTDRTVAGQIGAGFRYDIGSRFSVTLGYKYFRTRKAVYHLDPVDAPYKSDSILAGVRMSFAKAPPAPAPVAVQAPEPLPQAEIAMFEKVWLRPVNFKFDKSDLTEPARAALDEVAEGLLAYPALRVLIEGHCDYIGTDAYNMALGMRRANAVRRYLLERGVPEDQLEVKSFGESEPRADNRTRDGRAANRRVEFDPLETPEALEVITEDSNEETWRAAHGPEDPVRDPPGTAPEGSDPP